MYVHEVTVQYQTATKIIENTPNPILNLITTLWKTMDPYITSILYILVYSVTEYLYTRSARLHCD